MERGGGRCGPGPPPGPPRQRRRHLSCPSPPAETFTAPATPRPPGAAYPSRPRPRVPTRVLSAHVPPLTPADPPSGSAPFSPRPLREGAAHRPPTPVSVRAEKPATGTRPRSPGPAGPGVGTGTGLQPDSPCPSRGSPGKRGAWVPSAPAGHVPGSPRGVCGPAPAAGRAGSGGCWGVGTSALPLPVGHGCEPVVACVRGVPPCHACPSAVGGRAWPVRVGVCVCCASVSGGSNVGGQGGKKKIYISVQERGGISGHRAKGACERVSVCVRGCVYPPQRCSEPSAHGTAGRRALGAKLSGILLLVSRSASLFPSLPFFSPFPPLLFHCFSFSLPQGHGEGGRGGRQRILIPVAPAAPGAKRPLPGRGGACFPWQRSVPRPDLPFTPPLRGSPPFPPPPRGKRDPGEGVTPRPHLSLFCSGLFALDKQV